MVVAVAAIGALAYTRFANSPEPLALILRELGQPGAAQYLAASAVIALPTVILAFLYGQSRIFFVMARDGLLPREPGQGVERAARRCGSPSSPPSSSRCSPASSRSTSSPRWPMPARWPPSSRSCVCMLIMRGRAPDAPRAFRTPLRLAGRASARSSAASICSSACPGDPALLPGRPCRRARHLLRLRRPPQRRVARMIDTRLRRWDQIA